MFNLKQSGLPNFHILPLRYLMGTYFYAKHCSLNSAFQKCNNETWHDNCFMVCDTFTRYPFPFTLPEKGYIGATRDSEQRIFGPVAHFIFIIDLIIRPIQHQIVLINCVFIITNIPQVSAIRWYMCCMIELSITIK